MMWEPMGPTQLNQDIAEEFVVRLQKVVQKRDRGGGKLNAGVHFSVAMDILAYSLIPFLREHRVDLERVLAVGTDITTPEGATELRATMVEQLKVSPGQTTEVQNKAALAFACVLIKLAFFRLLMVRYNVCLSLVSCSVRLKLYFQSCVQNLLPRSGSAKPPMMPGHKEMFSCDVVRCHMPTLWMCHP
jgi:hypothetical protein